MTMTCPVAVGFGPESRAQLTGALSTDWGWGDPAVSSDSNTATKWDVRAMVN